MLTDEQVRALKKGDVLYNNAIWGTNKDGSVQHYTAVVTSVPRWNAKNPVIGIKRKYGNHGEGTISLEGRKLWRVTEEKAEEDMNVLVSEGDFAKARARKMTVRKTENVPTPVKTEKRVSVAPTAVPAPAKAPEQKAHKVDVAPVAAKRIVRTRKAIPLSDDAQQVIADTFDKYFG